MSSTCPLCKQPAPLPSLDNVIAAYRLNGFEVSILRAVWAGQGRRVETERIFDAMYANDPDGGPSPHIMYRAFNNARRSLNDKLILEGVAIVPVGHRRGYRISLRETDDLAS